MNSHRASCTLLAVTGSICSGKSFVCKLLRGMGFPSFSWDFEIRKLFKVKATRDQIEAKFPTSISEGQVDRKLLGALIFEDARKRKFLEDILYPAIFQRQEEFIEAVCKKGAKMIVIEVPLLYEKKMEKLYDYVLVTYANKDVIRKRAIRRKLSLQRLRTVLKIQTSNAYKKARADYLLNTNRTAQELICSLENIVKEIQNARTNP